MSFVTRDSATGNLMLDGVRLRWSGPNVAGAFGLSEQTTSGYGATVDADGLHLASHAEIDATIASAAAMGATVIRAYSSCMSVGKTNSIQPTLGSFNAAALEPVDYALQQCAAAGIRLVFPLVDNYQYYVGGKFWYCTANGVTPGADAAPFFTNSTVINSFKAHISYVLNHTNSYTGVKYKNDPTVLAWETGNELYISGAWSTSQVAWTNTISTHIKVTEAAQQLVVDGHSGLTSADTASLGLTNVDIYTDHTYNNSGNPAWVTSLGATCHSYGKAWWLGEYTWTGSGFSPAPTWTLDQMLDTIEESSYVDGDNYWQLLPQGDSWSDGFMLHWPGDNANMQTRAAMLADHARRMSREASTLTFVTDTFTGSNATALESHTGSVGATWDKQDGWTGAATIQSNRIYAGSTEAHYYTTGVPPSSDYTVSADIYVASITTFALTGVLGRAKTETDTSYAAFIYYNGSTTVAYLKRFVNGTGTDLASATITTPTVGTTHALELRMAGTALSLYWDGVLKVSATDANIPAAGRAGVLLYGGSATTGFHLDNLNATTPPVTLSIGGAPLNALWIPSGLGYEAEIATAGRPVGAMPSNANTGQPIVYSYNTTSAAQPVISTVGGGPACTIASTAAAAQAGYTTIHLTGNVTKLACDFVYGIGIHAWRDPFPAGLLTISVEGSVCHTAFKTTGWDYGIWNAGSGLAVVQSRTYSSARSNTAPQHVEVIIDKTAGVAWVTGDDGVQVRVPAAGSDSRISAYDCTYAQCEIYYNNAATEPRAAWTKFQAASAPGGAAGLVPCTKVYLGANVIWVRP